MTTLLHISQICALVALVTLLWLVVRAFRKHFLWGFAVLLLSPFSAVFFGIKHWKDAKQPFLAYLTSFGAAFGIGLYVFTAWGGWELARTAFTVHQGIKTQTLTERDAYAFMHANLQFIENASPDEYDRRKIDMIRTFISQHGQGMTDTGRKILRDDVTEFMQDDNLNKQQKQLKTFCRL